MHCKDVSIRDVSVPLTIEGISDLMDGWKAYKRTGYIVLRNGKELAVVKIERIDGPDLFQSLSSYEILALPEDTIYHEDAGLDVLNEPALASVQMLYPGKTVVVCGMFSHINFIKGIEPQRLRVIDNTPPSPSKLGVLVKMALASGFVEHPIILEEVDIDITDRIKDVRTDGVMFPCRVSNMKADMPFYFLDEAPKLSHEVTLIGCDLSKRIYDSLYGPCKKFINVCPIDGVPKDDVMTIVKCCKVKDGYVRKGNLVIVPWGATVPEIVSAINDLFSE